MSADFPSLKDVGLFVEVHGEYPDLRSAQIEHIERTHFPELFEVCHTPVLPKPAVLQALWRNCTDY